MTDLIERKSAALKAFTAIGKKNGSSCPESTSNNFSAAYEYMIADALRSAASARYEAAKAAAIAEGVISEEYTPGTHVPYSASGLTVVAKCNNDSTTLDKTALANILMRKHGFDKPKLDALLAEASKVRKGNLIFSVSME